MSKKVMVVLLMSALVLSFMCGCQNGDAESVSSMVSKTENSVSSSDESNTESSKQSESIVDKDYEEMMKYVNQLSPDLTDEQIYEIMGDPDGNIGSGICYVLYNFGKYEVYIETGNFSAFIWNNETKERTDLY